jgi:hypothetical protein
VPGDILFQGVDHEVAVRGADAACRGLVRGVVVENERGSDRESRRRMGRGNDRERGREKEREQSSTLPSRPIPSPSLPSLPTFHIFPTPHTKT